MSGESTRRDWLRVAMAAGATAGAASAARAESMIDVKFAPTPALRIGLIGTGVRGNGLIRYFQPLEGVRFTALCDLLDSKAAEASAVIVKAGTQAEAPALYSGSETAYEKLLARDDIDLVLIATPWRWHTTMAVAAMRASKHVGVEVPAALTIEECWHLVDTSEKTRRHCMQLENCCYGYNELLVLNLVKAGLLGELTHAECAYNHDLRSQLFQTEGEGLWRRAEHLRRNGNLYPTHGLGPVANYLGINRGDRFDTLVSLSSLSVSLAAYRDTHLASDDARRRETYLCGDHNVSLIRTARGRLITLEHNVVSPQPQDRINLIAGTKGMFRDNPARLYIDGKASTAFTSLDAYKKQYEHPWWTRSIERVRRDEGHGGMDYVMARRIAEFMKQGLAPDMDVYDAAALSAPGPLSEASVRKGGAPVRFPDFTRGRSNQRQ
jgi:predicted dehydrogenase